MSNLSISWQFHPSISWTITPNCGFLTIQYLGIGYSWTATKIFWWIHFYFGSNRLLFKVGWNSFSKRGQKEKCSRFHSSTHHLSYVVLHYIIINNGKFFCNAAMNRFCEKFHFKQYNSSTYYATANGLAEIFNKILCNLLNKIVDKSKKDWHIRIREILWAYRTTFRIPTQATPYTLAYGVEVVLLLERQIRLLKIVIQEGISEKNNVRLRLEELEALDENRLKTQQRIECYQTRLSKVFNKRVWPCSFQIRELVLAVQKPIILTHDGQRKFTPKWDGLYIVQKVYTNGLYKLIVEDGLRIGSSNGKYLKWYYAQFENSDHQ